MPLSPDQLKRKDLVIGFATEIPHDKKYFVVEILTKVKKSRLNQNYSRMHPQLVLRHMASSKYKIVSLE